MTNVKLGLLLATKYNGSTIASWDQQSKSYSSKQQNMDPAQMSTNMWIHSKKVWYIYSMEYYSDMKMKSYCLQHNGPSFKPLCLVKEASPKEQISFPLMSDSKYT